MSKYLDLTLFVPGKPIAQGSMKNLGGGVMAHSNDGLMPWRYAIGYAARQKLATLGITDPILEPMSVTLSFYFDRPKSVSIKSRPRHNVYPDLDKLVRAVCDALTGACWKDDAQVFRLSAQKEYIEKGKWPNEPGVNIVLHTWGEGPYTGAS